MLERHEVEAFLTLAEELHFGRTAERLRVSTARISQTIAKPERRTGIPLFERTSRRVELTAAGRRLYEGVRPAWDQITGAFEQAVASGRGLTGTLRVAFVPFEDAPPLRWGLLWRADNATARLRAFAEAAHDLAGTA
ncbi:hypothetical protein GCM10027187_28990 [Streptosporangium sandarakinum]|uniref:DNA-binding transcriptional LysR family regulator n=1 Tax=Streptosporangium sandarakinum TaxID=1260955 RepID=A0A852V3U4_9ACTN|nr:LysR family transcriptional regulator [Streptosporangium sandarakinum]NYF44497.1 DNA-binding transcriptional LysR family regulator [Streptosporangium sandarakinum]